MLQLILLRVLFGAFLYQNLHVHAAFDLTYTHTLLCMTYYNVYVCTKF